MAIEADSYVKEGILGLHPEYRAIVVAPPTRISNPHLVSYLKQRLTFVVNPFLCMTLKPFARMKTLQYDVTHYAQVINGSSTAPLINRRWGARPALWNLSQEDVERGWKCLQSLGVPRDSWFVCFHCREKGFLQTEFHDYRDVSVENYMLAVKAIVVRGGWAIRMGDPTMRGLPKMEGVVDYCHESLRSDWMDTFLCACCRFFLGSGSGISWVSSIFGVPVATANAAPLTHALVLRPGDLGIPKLYWSKIQKRYLSFSEILDSGMGDFRFTKQFHDAQIELIENSPEEIRDLCLEMLDRVEGKAVYTAEDQALNSRFAAMIRPGHFSYGSAVRMGRDFLRRYQELL